MSKKTSIFIDIDDVCADWLGAACDYLDFKWDDTNSYIPLDRWDTLLEHQRFYRDLPLKEGAIELVDWATEYTAAHNMNLAFLTAVPHAPYNTDIPYIYQDKIHWVSQHFPSIPVFFGPYSMDKHLHCRPGDILIDDRRDNCADWVAAGGIAHIYTTWEDCKAWIDLGMPQCKLSR